MEKITQGHPMTQSPDFVKENIETLKSLFPTIVKEGKIDWSELQALLGNEIETEDEYYRLMWAGKSMARKEANKPSTATLRPNKTDSKDWNTTQNIFIEGDNLEVLKLLQKSYAKKIKLIYIDPPYNTGSDFVYKDDYADNLSNYLALTGQIDDSGKRTSTNSESDGRYHSNWINMIYSRLKLARNLMSKDGVIFISIDDNEVHNLRKVCDELFGEVNFISALIWQRAFSPKNDAKFFSNSHDYILVYAKSIDFCTIERLERTDEANEKYKNQDNDLRGEWTSGDLSVKTYSEKYDYPITTPSGRIVNPPHGACWRVSKERFEELRQDNRIWFGEKGENVPRLKRFLSDVQDGMVPTSIWFHKEVGHNQEGRQELKALFDDKGYFDGPKPVRLLSRILKVAGIRENDIVLDFFAGSGTTAHAVMQMNANDNGSRKFIMVQLPEPTEEKSDAFNAGFKTIADITKERIHKAGEKVKSGLKDDLFSSNNKTLDIGFKAFKLDSSNIKAWDGNPENLEANLFNAGSNIKENRTEEDVLYEILLKNGLDLAQPIEQQVFAGKTVFNVGVGTLFICLAEGVTTEVAEGIGQWKQELDPATCKVIFKDNGFTDVEKTNSMQILKRYGIEEVNTI